jgi:protein-S-isoprenylcysteine O-methyltransferase Ste14
MGEEWLYRIVTVVGMFLIFGIYTHSYRGPFMLWRLGREAEWGLCAVVVLGFAFAWWARLHLGRLWSGWVTKKADHRVVDTGPYRIVRHPIYTGIILAAAATAIQKGTLVAVAGVAVVTLGFWIKARLEERFLRQELGPDAYNSYRRRVPMLLPFGPKSA